MSGAWVQGLQLFAGLSILVALHEFGHFFFARLFKTRVEKFYIFFDFLFPFSSVLNFALFKKKKGDTEYGIGWFPLGGYVKIAGMVDERMDKEQMALPRQPWEYRSKKPYQRLFIMLGGIIVNIIVAMLIYMVVFSVYGEEYLPTQNARYGIMVDSLAQSIGLRNGDIVTSVDHEPVPRFNSIVTNFIFHKDNGSIEVSRNGKDTSLAIPRGVVGQMLGEEKANFLAPRVPAVVGAIVPGSIAQRMKMQVDDSIIAVNGQPIFFHDQFDSIKRANFGVPMAISFMRAGNVMSVNVVIPRDSILGFARYDNSRYFAFTKVHYNPIQAVQKGFSYTFDQFGYYIRQFGLFRHEVKASKSVGGLISFGKIFPPEFNMRAFLMLTAFISVILAFMNLLPIPGLDGGYVIFLLWEMITGKAVSDKVMERATTVGLVLLLTLMVYANGMDIFKLFKH